MVAEKEEKNPINAPVERWSGFHPQKGIHSVEGVLCWGACFLLCFYFPFLIISFMLLFSRPNEKNLTPVRICLVQHIDAKIFPHSLLFLNLDLTHNSARQNIYVTMMLVLPHTQSR